MEKFDLITYLLDYAPLLAGNTASIVYLYYYSLKDDNNIVELTYEELHNHLGISTSTIRDAINTLKSMGLIRRPRREGEPELFSPSRFEVVPIGALSSAKRKEVFGETKRKINTSIRKRLLHINNVSIEYQQLIDKKSLLQAYKKLGGDGLNLRDLTAHFGLDKSKVRLLVSNPDFQKEFKKVRESVLQHEGEIEAQPPRVRKRGKKDRSVDDMYATLMKCHLDKEGQPIPVEEWKPVQLLRYFCVCYEQTNRGKKYILPLKNGSFSCRELRDINTVLSTFDKDAKRVAQYIKWTFRVKDKVLPDGITGTGILAAARMMNEFSRNSDPIVVKRNAPLDPDYLAWIEENVPNIFKQFQLDNMDGLYWIKEAYDKKKDRATDATKQVVQEGIRRGIIPKKGNLEFEK